MQPADARVCDIVQYCTCDTLGAKNSIAKNHIAKNPIAKISVKMDLTLRFPAKIIIAKISVTKPIYHFWVDLILSRYLSYKKNFRNTEIICVVEFKNGYHGVSTN